MTKLSASLVLYHNDPQVYSKAITSFLEGHPHGELVVVDNSATPLQNDLFSHPRVKYVHAGANLGFGAGHNLALSKIGNDSDLHVFINPDIAFGPDVLPYLVSVFEADPAIGAAMPQVLYPDGRLQHLCKLLPTPFDLAIRRFPVSRRLLESVNRRYELHGFPQDRIVDAPTLSGCFLMARTSLLRKIGGFDTRYFMYMEDFDLVRRIGNLARTVYAPGATVVHGYARGSHRNLKLLKYHVISMIKYFNKWGWLRDPVRRTRNHQALQLLERSGT